MRRFLGLIALGAVTVGLSSASAGTLNINANASDPAPRAAWEWAVAVFQRENPDIVVKFNVFDHESYKKSIRMQQHFIAGLTAGSEGD